MRHFLPIFCSIFMLTKGFKNQPMILEQYEQDLVPEIAMVDYDSFIQIDDDRPVLVGYVVDESWAITSMEFVCHFNEVAVAFQNNSAAWKCNQTDGIFLVDTTDKIRFGLVGVDKEFMDKHAIKGIPQARLFMPDGRMIPYNGNYFMFYPSNTFNLRNFLCKEVFGEHSEFNYISYYDEIVLWRVNGKRHECTPEPFGIMCASLRKTPLAHETMVNFVD